MWVLDCATDSVLKKFSFGEGGELGTCIRWVPWSNRIYLINNVWAEGYLAIIDCNTDTVIWSRECTRTPATISNWTLSASAFS